MHLHIALSAHGEEEVVHVGGVIDFASVPYLRHAVFQLFDRGRARIALDLARVRLVDAAAIRMLVYLRQRAEHHGGGLRVVRPTATTLGALEVAGVAKELGAYDDDRAVPDGAGVPVDLDGIRLTGMHWPPAVTADLTELYRGGLTPDRRRGLRARIIESCMPAVRRIAHRYTRTSEPAPDLEQVAYLGLIKAVDGFDPDRSVEFAPYATVTVAGELKRYFRDQAWAVHVPRYLQERWLAVHRDRDKLAAGLGRAPTAGDIAAHLGLDEAEVLEAQGLDRTYRPLSLDLPADADDPYATMLDRLGGDDPGISGVDHHESLRVLLPQLPQRARQVLAMRFYGGLPQREIGDRLGVSQMQVSRILRQALSTLRRRLEEVPPG